MPTSSRCERRLAHLGARVWFEEVWEVGGTRRDSGGEGWGGVPMEVTTGDLRGGVWRAGRASTCCPSRLRLARMAEEMREAEAPAGQAGLLAGSSPTELQYRRCIQEFISLHLEES